MADQPPDELAPRRKRGVKPGRQVGSARGPISGKKEIETRHKQAQALALRQGGATLQQVADRVGYSDAGSAHRAVMAALATVLPDETREAARKLELSRLDALILAHWPSARGSANDAGERVFVDDFDKHARIVLQAVNMRARIQGLEAPAQVNLNVFDGEAVEITIAQLLSDEQMTAALKMRNEVMEMTRLRAGAIDVDPE